MASAKGGVRRSVEPNITLFSPAEIRVAMIPVGEAPDAEFQRCASLITRHKQVKLSHVRTFHHEAHKTPFKHIPWKSGNMNFKFLGEEAALAPSPLSTLHAHRAVLGVIGILHCGHTRDLAKACRAFQQRCHAFKGAFTVRLFGFDPTDAQVGGGLLALPGLDTFPPGATPEHLQHHAEVVMHDYAACMLGELERWMLSASPAMLDLGSLVDAPEFTGAGPLEAVQTRLYSDEEVKTKKRYGRLQKAMGDHCLLAGSPRDALDHFNVAADLCRVVGDWVFQAGALEGQASAKALEAAMDAGGYTVNQASVFTDDKQWRRGRDGQASGTASEAGTPVSSRDLGSGDRQASGGVVTSGLEVEQSGSNGTAPQAADDALSQAGTGTSTAFGGPKFWKALRSSGVEGEVRAHMAEAKAALRRKGVLPLQAEADLKLARFLAGLHGEAARAEVSDLVTGVLSLVEGMPLPEDRMLAFVEGAGALGLVGSLRKRMLLLWQAVELSKYLGFPNLRSLEVARKALEPPDRHMDPVGLEEPWSTPRSALHRESPSLWPQVRAGCLEAILGLAIYAKQHAEVWEAAAVLLRDHPAELSPHRQQSLLENMLAAAAQMAPAERARPGPGPPPLLRFLAARPSAPALQLVALGAPAPASPGTPGGPFLYDPFAARRGVAAAAGAAAAAGHAPLEWVVGEPAAVEVEVSNPSAVSLRIDRMVLEVEYLGTHDARPVSPAAQPTSAWRNKPVSLNIPPATKPVRIQLEGTPQLPGTIAITGCKLSAFGGVTWVQAWEAPIPPLGQTFAVRGGGGGGHDARAAQLSLLSATRVHVLPALPTLELTLEHSDAASARLPEGLGLQPGAVAAAAAGGSAAAAEPWPCLRLLGGQRASLLLRVRNRGRVPAARAALEATCASASASGTAAARSEGLARLEVEVGALAAGLPLAPGAELTVPVDVAMPAHAPRGGDAEASGGAPPCELRFALDYGGAGAGPALGRRSVLVADVAPLRSVAVGRARFCAVPGVDAAAGGGTATARTTFILLVAATNRSAWHLDVRLARVSGGPDAGRCPAGVTLAPGESAEVAHALSTADEAAVASTVLARGEAGSAGSTITRRPGASAATVPEDGLEALRSVAAHALASALELRFTPAEGGGGGAAAQDGRVPLPERELSASLARPVLARLAGGGAVQGTLSATGGAGARACDLPPDALLEMVSSGRDGSSPGHSLAALVCGVGESVRLTLSLRAPVTSVRARAALTCGAVDGAWPAEAAGGGAAAFWTGQVEDIRLLLSPGKEPLTHSVSLRLAAPGRYRIGVEDLGCSWEDADQAADGGRAPPLLDVEPCYIHVTPALP
ncbi:hypothetical protein ACKKBF_B08795 [Auxenochlorella protothecoides x Auxenochlorella symbiontica]